MKRLRFFVFGLVVLIVGIFWFLYRGVSKEEQNVRTLAKREAYARGWNFARVTEVTNISNKWTVRLEMFPPTLGGHASVDIVDGSVTQYRPGK